MTYKLVVTLIFVISLSLEESSYFSLLLPSNHLRFGGGGGVGVCPEQFFGPDNWGSRKGFFTGVLL